MTTSPGNRFCPRSFVSIFPLAIAIASSLVAQTTAPAPASAGDSDEPFFLEKVVVTGSAIPLNRGETFAPVKLFLDEDFAQIGAGTVVEAVRTIPGLYGDMPTDQKSNGGSGANGVNFRALGGALTLLDGHRTSGFVEYNLLPRIAVSGLEVLKDGASARYGSDALAGVFNPILVQSYSGSKLDVYYGNTTDTDAGTLRVGLLAGGRRGSTDIVIASEYYKRNTLMSADREVSANGDMRALGGINTNTASFSGRTTGRRNGGPIENLMLSPGVSVPASAADYTAIDTNTNTSQQLYNLRQLTPSIPSVENKSFYTRINQSIFGDYLEAYARILYSRSTFDSALAPFALSLAASAVNSSPYIPANLTVTGATVIRPSAIGSRGRYYDREGYDILAGLRGKISDTWSWEAGYYYSAWNRDDVQSGAVSVSALRNAINNGSYNPFALSSAKGATFDNPAVLNAASRDVRASFEADIRGGDFIIGGTLFNLPAGELKVAVGGEYYRNDQSTVPSPEMWSGDFSTSILTYSGSVSRSFNKGVFAELLVPVISRSMNVPAVYSLDLSLSGRTDRQTVEGYNNGLSTGPERTAKFKSTNPKVGIRYRPVEDVVLRGTWGTGFRVPFLFYMFAGASTSNRALQDPLGYAIGGTTPITTTGKPDLDPEESTTWSAGVEFTPKAIRGLKLSVDYYYAQIEGLVGEGAQYMVNVNAMGQGASYVPGNPATLNPNAPFAQNITRNGSGSITAVNSTYLNVAERETTGVDTTITYVWPWENAGKWTSAVDWNTTLTWDLRLNKSLPSRNQLGKFGDPGTDPTTPGSVPRNRGYFSQGWEKGSWSVAARVNYISHMEDELGRTFAVVPDAAGNPVFTRKFRYVEEWVTFDAQVKYRLPKLWSFLEKSTLRLGCVNLTDEPAPLAVGAFNDSYDQVMHSNRGRFVYTNLTVEF